jgi:Arc/MetJ-type ribon-helix-helix transcriptional regulator
MKRVLLSLTDNSEKRLRRLAQAKGGEKGSLSETVEEALLLLEKQLRQKNALERLQALADEDRVLGVGTFDREEAYR